MKNRKKLFLGVLSLLTLIGTFGGLKGCQPLRLIKDGRSYGINVSIGSVYGENARHYGVNIGFGNYFSTGSKVYGFNIGVVNIFSGGDINGVTLGVVDSNSPDSDSSHSFSNIKGLEAAIVSLPSQYLFDENTRLVSQSKIPVKVDGFQTGLIVSGQGNVFQLGGYCYNVGDRLDSGRGRPLINWRFE